MGWNRWINRLVLILDLFDMVQNQGSVGRKSDKRSRVRQLTDMLWNDRMCSLERQGGRKKLLWPKSTRAPISSQSLMNEM